MAELILTEAERAAATWLEFDDAALGRVVKHAAVTFMEAADELKRIRHMAAAMILVGAADQANAERLTETLQGLTRKGVDCGDWRITIERTRAPEKGA